jgi:signal transduction histidine kinase
MNPTATHRFRQATAGVLVVWALFAMVCNLWGQLRRDDDPDWPLEVSSLGDVAIVQETTEEALAQGVEPGDRLVALDGVPVMRVFGRARDFLQLGVPNTYLLEKRDGTRIHVELLPQPPQAPSLHARALSIAIVCVGLAYLVIGIGIWRLKSERAESWALLLFCAVVATQLFTTLGTDGIPWAYPRVMVNAPLIGATAFHLFTTYPIEPAWIVRHRRIQLVPYGLALGLIALFFLEGPLGLPETLVPATLLFYTLVCLVASFVVLMLERREAEHQVRDRADIMLLGGLVSFLPVALIVIAQYLLRTTLPYYYAMLWLFVFPAAVGYGIVQKQLFEIRNFAKSSAAYGAVTLTITGVFAFLIAFSDAVVSRFNVNARSAWFQVGFLVLAILAFNPLRNRMQELVDRLFDRDRATYRLAVREISEAMVSMLSLREIGERMLVAITDTMGVERSLLLLLDDEERVLRAASLRGVWDEESQSLEIPAGHPIWKHLWMRREELSRADFDDEPDPETREACWDVFDTLEVELLVPVLFGVDLLGVIAVGRKLSGDRLGVDDRQLLRTLANQSAIAIENAKAYDEIAKLNETLEARVEERTAELRQTQAQLVQSEKMRSLGQLVAGVAHELNNPIGFVHANLQLLDRYVEKLRTLDAGSPEAEKTREAVNKLLARSREGTERVKKIVMDLRTFSRLDQAELQEVDLHEGIERTLSLMEPRLKEGIRVEREYGELPPVRCFAGQLNQVFMNLLMNACDALEGRGTIRIRTQRAGEGVRLEFSDDGPGIPPEVQSRIFEPFFTTKPVGKGTGLGLSLSHGIVERHGGSISVESDGSGTTFRIDLPLDAAPYAAAAEAAAAG